MSGVRFTMPLVQWNGITGVPFIGGQLSFFVSGGNTPAPVYADSGLTTPLNQPALSLQNGYWPSIFLDPSILYAAELLDPVSNQVWTADPVGQLFGTAATANIGTSGAVVGLLNANLTFGGNNTFTGNNIVQGTFTVFASAVFGNSITVDGGAQTTPVSVVFSAMAMVVNCNLSNVFRTTMTGNVATAPTFTNLRDGQTINWFLTQDGTGTRTMTWPTNFKWPGGVAGVLSVAAGAVDLLVATYTAASGNWFCGLGKAYA